MSDIREFEAKWTQQGHTLANRLRKKQRHLRKWARRNQVTCYRIYHLDVPDLPFSIDWYHDALYISEWKKRHTHPEELHPIWLEWMYETICEALEIEREQLFIKQRERQKGVQQYEKFGEERQRHTVEEGGLQFWVNLTDYLDTGLFLDHRTTRGMVRAEAQGKRVLNLFAYTGSFSVYAADGGATHTTTVDMSNTYVQWAKDNMLLNGFEGEQHTFVQSDVFAFLKDAARNQEQYDLIVLDPPTFSNSKRMDGSFDVQRDHVFLVQRCLELLAPEGILYFSNNFKKFSLDEEAVREASEYKEITHKTIPEDFRGSKIHCCWRIVA